MSQSYMEGSSWKAYKVRDRVWIDYHDDNEGTDPLAALSSDYVFGCQTAQTGLFASQVSNGIMGFADTEDTLVPTMVKQGVLQHRIFSLCFARTGGAITLGGIDVRNHQGQIDYAPMSISSKVREGIE